MVCQDSDGEKVGPGLGPCRGEGRAFSLQDPSTCPTNPTVEKLAPRRPGEKGPNGLPVSACRYWCHQPQQGYVGAPASRPGRPSGALTQGALPLTLCADL